MIAFPLRIAPLIDKLFIHILILYSHSVRPSPFFLLVLQQHKIEKHLYNFFYFQVAVMLILYFYEPHIFHHAFHGFVSNSTSAIALYFSESDNLFRFKLVIFHNKQLQCNYN